jgi:hypothetical protein
VPSPTVFFLVIAESVLEDDPVTSTAPPLSRPPAYLTHRRGSSPGWSGQPNRIHWPVIFASVAVSFALVAGVFAWIATHPHKAASSPDSIRVAIIEPPTIPRAALALPQAPVFSTTPVVHHLASREKVSSNVPLIEIDSPPLSQPATPQTKRQPQRWDQRLAGLGGENRRDAGLTVLSPMPEQPAGETYGTQVLFLNNQEAAADKARHEHKLMFVMHISGNFEDSCFT